MSIILSEEEKLRYLYYKLIELRRDALEAELNSWSQLTPIDWLCWNYRNEVYRDEDSLRQFGNKLSKGEAIEIISRQIGEA